MAKLPKLSTRAKILLGIVAIFGLINLGYQFWSSLHQAALLEQAEPKYLVMAILCQILVYIALMPAFRAYFAAANIDLSANSSLRLIVAGLGLAKVIPLGEYIVWRRQLRHHHDGVGSVTRLMILYYFWTFACLALIFVLSEGLAFKLYSKDLTQSLASKFMILPIAVTCLGVLGLVAWQIHPIRRIITNFCSKHLGSPMISPWRITRNLNYTGADLLILISSITLTLVVEATTLLLCLRAVGVTAPFLLVIFGYSFARFFSLIPVSPGGVGEVEAGTTFFFAAYGYNASIILTATVLFRLLTYWLPIAIGVISYARLGHEHEPYWPLHGNDYIKRAKRWGWSSSRSKP